MIQEVFREGSTASAAAGFVGLLSLANIGGRIGWASLSDYVGRKRTYFVFFALGTLLYALAPTAGRLGNVALFVGIFCVILTMYGGGFATIPAYLADIFGTQFACPSMQSRCRPATSRSVRSFASMTSARPL